jgi:hypothetical protein
MECPNHKGREMDGIIVDPPLCDKCGVNPPPTQTGWRCRFDGQEFDMDGNKIEPVPAAAPEPEAVAPVVTKKRKSSSKRKKK